jgi:hypothetical protein
MLATLPFDAGYYEGAFKLLAAVLAVVPPLVAWVTNFKKKLNRRILALHYGRLCQGCALANLRQSS